MLSLLFRNANLRLARMAVAFCGFALAALAQQNSACGTTPSGRNFAGQNLNQQNFSHQDLTDANFENATLTAVSFLGANLTNASFKNATITNDSTSPMLSTDFSLADLTGTCFQGAHFTGTTYFTYSTLTCSDFSEADISTNPVFGPSPLKFDRSSTCRPSFRAATMNCEFIKDWQYLDLTSANIGACMQQLTKNNFANAEMAGVDFSGADLDGSDFTRATLTKARFYHASLQSADLSYAQLQGANLDYANLSGANLYHAFLSNDTQGQVDNAASAQHAHLKNVNLSFAQLSGVDFSFANFYGAVPAGQGVCSTEQENYQGFTHSCASAHGATLSNTNFSSAYLFGVDFTDAEMRGVNFGQAILVGANLACKIETDIAYGNPTNFSRTLLQGTNLAPVTLADQVSGGGAFVDFAPHGNIIDIYLAGADHNQFPCGSSCNPSTGADVCVEIYYPQPSSVPGNNQDFSCPDGNSGPCGDPTDSNGNYNLRWRSPLLAGQLPPGIPMFWYVKNPASFPPSWTTKPCNGGKSIFGW